MSEMSEIYKRNSFTNHDGRTSLEKEVERGVRVVSIPDKKPLRTTYLLFEWLWFFTIWCLPDAITRYISASRQATAF